MDDNEQKENPEQPAQIEERPPEAKILKLLTYSIPALLLLVCILIIGIAKAMRTSSAPEHSASADEENPLLDCNHSMPLPFGMKARNQCIAACYSPGIDRELCSRGCDHLASNEYARRITLDEQSEAQAAAEIAAGCQEIAKAGTKVQPMDAWVASAKKAVRTFGETPMEIDVYEYQPAIQRYALFKGLERDAIFPEGEDAAAREMAIGIRAAICLRQSVAASELAIAEIADSFDFHSERYYRSLESELTRLSRDAELAVMNQYGNVIHSTQEAQP